MTMSYKDVMRRREGFRDRFGNPARKRLTTLIRDLRHPERIPPEHPTEKAVRQSERDYRRDSETDQYDPDLSIDDIV